MLILKENDIILWKGQKGVVQFVGETEIVVFFIKDGKLEIFNKDGASKKDSKCLKVDLSPAEKNLTIYKEPKERSINLKSKYLH